MPADNDIKNFKSSKKFKIRYIFLHNSHNNITTMLQEKYYLTLNMDS